MISKLSVFALLCCYVLLAGCSNDEEITQELSEQHMQYLESYGWHIRGEISKTTKVVDYLPELLQGIKLAGLDLEPYKNKEVVMTYYALNERQKTGGEMYATIYEYNGEIIGGHGGLEDWDPGRFSLQDQERLIQDGIMDPITGRGTETKQENNMPKVMPDDFDFMVRYGYGGGRNEINTYQDTVTKDLVMKGTATANIALTHEEMTRIYEKMREINIMGEKELIPAGNHCSRTPYTVDSWKISIDGETIDLTWSGENCNVTNDAQQLSELRIFIKNIVVGKDAYKELPQAEGGYD